MISDPFRVTRRPSSLVELERTYVALLFLDYSRNWTLDFLTESPLVVRIGTDLGTPQGCYLGARLFTHRGRMEIIVTPGVTAWCSNITQAERGALQRAVGTRVLSTDALNSQRRRKRAKKITRDASHPARPLRRHKQDTESHPEHILCTFIDFTNILKFLCSLYFGSFICFIL